MTDKFRWVGTNERGARIGVYHPRSKLTEHDIDLIFELAEGDRVKGIARMAQKEIASKFEVSESTISKIIHGVHHGQAVKRWRKISLLYTEPS